MPWISSSFLIIEFWLCSEDDLYFVISLKIWFTIHTVSWSDAIVWETLQLGCCDADESVAQHSHCNTDLLLIYQFWDNWLCVCVIFLHRLFSYISFSLSYCLSVIPLFRHTPPPSLTGTLNDHCCQYSNSPSFFSNNNLSLLSASLSPIKLIHSQTHTVTDNCSSYFTVFVSFRSCHSTFWHSQ